MVTLFVCGDVMLGRGIDQILPQPCEPILYESYITDARDYIEIAEARSGPIPRGVPPEYPWGDALGILDAARPDARIINLETSITRSDAADLTKGINYRVSPQNAATLTAARVDVCALANNHVLDWGEPGLRETLQTLDQLGIARTGAGLDLARALQPAVIELGERGRVAVFSVGALDAGVPASWAAGAHRPGVHVLADRGDESMRRLRDAVDPWRAADTLIVLSIHWGPNWRFAITSEDRRFAYRLIDEAGVDFVHGHSSHHVKGIEVHRGRPILYGCGDLLTDYEGIRGHETYRGDLGLLYFATFDASRSLSKLEMVPTQMQRFRVTRAGPEAMQWLAMTLSRSGESLGTSVTLADEHLALGW
jgi:poly-gamma-glutamate capsule biosynthesis protein CapA/YwtB (metallophosphatase superfamily)